MIEYLWNKRNKILEEKMHTNKEKDSRDENKYHRKGKKYEDEVKQDLGVKEKKD